MRWKKLALLHHIVIKKTISVISDILNSQVNKEHDLLGFAGKKIVWNEDVTKFDMICSKIYHGNELMEGFI